MRGPPTPAHRRRWRPQSARSSGRGVTCRRASCPPTPTRAQGPPSAREHGMWLTSLAVDFDLVWATSWEHDADPAYRRACRLTSGACPVITFESPDTGWTTKPPDVIRFVEDRPVAWVDDALVADEQTGPVRAVSRRCRFSTGPSGRPDVSPRRPAATLRARTPMRSHRFDRRGVTTWGHGSAGLAIDRERGPIGGPRRDHRLHRARRASYEPRRALMLIEDPIRDSTRSPRSRPWRPQPGRDAPPVPLPVLRGVAPRAWAPPH